jgi:hypothetical protein
MNCIKLEVWLVRWLDDFIEGELKPIIGFGAQGLGQELQISVGDCVLTKSITSPVRFPYTVCSTVHFRVQAALNYGDINIKRRSKLSFFCTVGSKLGVHFVDTKY